MRLIYTGPHDAVDVSHEGRTYTAIRGGPVDLPASLGRSLLEQGTWKEPRPEPRPTPAAKGRKED